MDAENTHQVFDWLWSSGQLSGQDIRRLPALGIEVVVNLALPTSSNALPGEAELVTREGLAYVQIPVEWEHPQTRAVRAIRRGARCLSRAQGVGALRQEHAGVCLHLSVSPAGSVGKRGDRVLPHARGVEPGCDLAGFHRPGAAVKSALN